MDLAWGDEDAETILFIEYPHFGTLDSSVCVRWSLLFFFTRPFLDGPSSPGQKLNVTLQNGNKDPQHFD